MPPHAVAADSERMGAREITVTPKTIWAVLGSALALVAGLFLLWKLRMVLSWTLVALLLALALEPLVEALTRRRVKRPWAVVIVFIAMLAFLVTLFATLLPLVVQQARELLARGPELLERLRTAPPIAWAEAQFHLIARVEQAMAPGNTDFATPAVAVAVDVLRGLAAIVTTFALTIFMLLFGRSVFDGAMTWCPPQRRERVRDTVRRMRKVVGGYVLGSLTVASIGGALMALTTAVLGVPWFLPLGLVMVLLGLVPFLGSAIGALLVVGITFATEGLRDGIIVAAVYLVYQQIENHVLQPLVQRRTIRMNPLLIALAVLAGTALGGVLGALLALPVAGSVQVLLHDALARRRARWGETVPVVEPIAAPVTEQ